MLRDEQTRDAFLMRFCTPLGVLILSCAASSGSASVGDELRICLAIEDTQSRVNCYDRLARGLPPASPPSHLSSSELFGMEVANARQLEPESIESHILGEIDGWRDGTKFTLANGQVWQISDGSRGVHYARDSKVRVRRGALGTFYLEFEGLNRSPQVKRLK